jgi:hypothetical protein
MFEEFAVTVTTAIIVSMFVSVTLTPMLGARLLQQEHPERQWRSSRGLEWCFDALLRVYDRALVVALRHRFVTLMVIMATVAATGLMFMIIPKGFFPEQDTGLILGITEAAENISPDGMGDRPARRLAGYSEGSRRCVRRRHHRRRRRHIDGKPGASLHRAETAVATPGDHRAPLLAIRGGEVNSLAASPARGAFTGRHKPALAEG